MIERREIQRFAARHQVPEVTIEKDYVITRVLSVLGPSMAPRGLAFKGGTCLKKCYFPDYRFSEDLDFTLEHAGDAPDGASGFLEDLITTLADLGIVLTPRDEIVHENGVSRITDYLGPLGRSRKLKVDVTTNERVLLGVADRPLADEYSDAPAAPRALRAYALQEVALEKLVCLLDPARVQPRDLYDLAFLIEQGVGLHEVAWAFQEKATLKGLDPGHLSGRIEAKRVAMKRLWGPRLGDQLPVGALPEFEATERKVLRMLREHGLV